MRRSLDERFGIVGGEEVLDVRLRFALGVAAYIARRVWHPTQEVRRLRDGRVELRMRTRGWTDLVRFVCLCGMQTGALLAAGRHGSTPDGAAGPGARENA